MRKLSAEETRPFKTSVQVEAYQETINKSPAKLPGGTFLPSHRPSDRITRRAWFLFPWRRTHDEYRIFSSGDAKPLSFHKMPFVGFLKVELAPTAERPYGEFDRTYIGLARSARRRCLETGINFPVFFIR